MAEGGPVHQPLGAARDPGNCREMLDHRLGGGKCWQLCDSAPWNRRLRSRERGLLPRVWNLAPAPGLPTLRLTFSCPALPGGDVRVKRIASFVRSEPTQSVVKQEAKRLYRGLRKPERVRGRGALGAPEPGVPEPEVPELGRPRDKGALEGCSALDF